MSSTSTPVHTAQEEERERRLDYVPDVSALNTASMEVRAWGAGARTEQGGAGGVRMHTVLCRQVAVGGRGSFKDRQTSLKQGGMWLHVLCGLTSYNETLRGARGALNRQVGCFGDAQCMHLSAGQTC